MKQLVHFLFLVLQQLSHWTCLGRQVTHAWGNHLPLHFSQGLRSYCWKTVFPSSPLLPAELEASREPALTCHFSLLWFSNRVLKNSSVGHWLTHLGFMCLWRQYSHRSSFPEHSLVWRLVCKKFTREALVGAWRKQDQTQLNCGPFSTKASAHSTEALMLGVLFRVSLKGGTGAKALYVCIFRSLDWGCPQGGGCMILGRRTLFRGQTLLIAVGWQNWAAGEWVLKGGPVEHSADWRPEIRWGEGGHCTYFKHFS